MAFIRDYPNALPRLAKRLSEVTVPCQITVGRHDPFVPVSNAEGLKKHLPKSKLNVLDCGHFAWEKRLRNTASWPVGLQSRVATNSCDSHGMIQIPNSILSKG